MIAQNVFIFTPGIWIGEGLIELEGAEPIRYFTRWQSVLADEAAAEFESTQEIQIAGNSDMMLNHYRFTGVTKNEFDVSLHNDAWGYVHGEGTYDDALIGWQFRDTEIGFEGYEYYDKSGENTYLVRAEFMTKDQLRTSIEGKIWKKAEEEDDEY